MGSIPAEDPERPERAALEQFVHVEVLEDELRDEAQRLAARVESLDRVDAAA